MLLLLFLQELLRLFSSEVPTGMFTRLFSEIHPEIPFVIPSMSLFQNSYRIFCWNCSSSAFSCLYSCIPVLASAGFAPESEFLHDILLGLLQTVPLKNLIEVHFGNAPGVIFWNLQRNPNIRNLTSCKNP